MNYNIIFIAVVLMLFVVVHHHIVSVGASVSFKLPLRAAKRETSFSPLNVCVCVCVWEG